MGRVETRKKQKKEAAETKFRTRKEQERGAVGEKNMRLGNPGKTISGKFSRPDDASITRTKKEEEQCMEQLKKQADRIAKMFGFEQHWIT